MKDNIRESKDFCVSDIFILKNGKGITRDEILENPGDLCAVQSGSDNNGVLGMIDKQYCKSMNYMVIETPCLTVARSGTSGFVTYQHDGCVIGDSAKALILKQPADMYVYLFLRTMLMANIYKYAYGRKVTIEKYMNQKISLPVNGDGKPDFEYMSQFIQSLHCNPITTKITSSADIESVKYGLFKIKNLFYIKKGKRLTKADMVNGNTNYIGAISNNNGVRQHICVDERDVCMPNCITVNYNGSVGEAFYQAEPFWASDDVNILYAKGWEMNQYNALYICTIIRANKYRFNYGRKWTVEKMQETCLRLPITENNEPDFEYMEGYIRSLLYSDRI